MNLVLFAFASLVFCAQDSYFSRFGNKPQLPSCQDAYLFQNIRASKGEEELTIDFDFIGSHKDFKRYEIILVPVPRPSVQFYNPNFETPIGLEEEEDKQKKLSWWARMKLWFKTMYRKIFKKYSNSCSPSQAWKFIYKSADKAVVKFKVRSVGAGSVKINVPNFLNDPERQMLAAVVRNRWDKAVVGFTEGITLDDVYRFAIERNQLVPKYLEFPKPQFVRMAEDEDDFKIYFNLESVTSHKMELFELKDTVFADNSVTFKLLYLMPEDPNEVIYYNEGKFPYERKYFLSLTLVASEDRKLTFNVVGSYCTEFKMDYFYTCNTKSTHKNYHIYNSIVNYGRGFGTMTAIIDSIRAGSASNFAVKEENNMIVISTKKNLNDAVHNERYWFDPVKQEDAKWYDADEDE